MWAAVAICPNISFAVSVLLQFMENPARPHWEVIKRVFKYLKGSKQLQLTYGKTKNGLTIYTDADWGSQSDRHSISGHIFIIDGGAVSWSSNKQRLIALSSAEAEYIATTHAIKEAFISKRNHQTTYKSHQYLLRQSSSNIAIKNNQFQAQTKHIDVSYKYIYGTCKNQIIILKYCPTDEMVADIFTKLLAIKKFQTFSRLFGLLPCST
jgi:hypothetical protein